MNALLAFLILIVVLMVAYLVRKILLFIADYQEFKTWLFNSLYSINHNVLLPTEMDKTEFKEAIVTADKDDPMKEFSGDHDDYFK